MKVTYGDQKKKLREFPVQMVLLKDFIEKRFKNSTMPLDPKIINDAKAVKKHID